MKRAGLFERASVPSMWLPDGLRWRVSGFCTGLALLLYCLTNRLARWPSRWGAVVEKQTSSAKSASMLPDAFALQSQSTY